MISITRREALAALTTVPLAAAPAQPAKVLLVVAHPDDEYYFAATTYRLAQELGAQVDQVIITSGEAGYRYSSLAEKIYGLPLSQERTGRSHLAQIRRREVLAAGRILGIRKHHFLHQQDDRFTLDINDALKNLWDCRRVRERLRDLLEDQRYDFVFTILPRASTHGHHKAATFLALDVVGSLDPSRRPVVLGAEPEASATAPAFEGLDGHPWASPATAAAEYSFDRHCSFGFRNALRYDIIVNWVISEHKSQGMFQNDVGRHRYEHFWRFAIGSEDGAARTASLFQQLQRPLLATNER